MVMAIHVRHAQLRERRSAADKDVVHHPQPHRMRERILLLVGQPYISTESSRLSHEDGVRRPNTVHCVVMEMRDADGIRVLPRLLVLHTDDGAAKPDTDSRRSR